MSQWQTVFRKVIIEKKIDEKTPNDEKRFLYEWRGEFKKRAIEEG